MSVVEELRQNDPEDTAFYIVLHNETSDADLAQALEQNPFVTEIHIDLEGDEEGEEQQQWPDWSSLVRVIATRANLEKVILEDAMSAEQRNAPAGLVRAFLHAIQQNTAIRSVEMRWLRLSTDISAFVDNASSITSFRLFDCHMEPAEREQGTRSLAAALQRDTNIETLELCMLEDIYAIPMLEGLRSNVSLKTFIFSVTSAYSATEVSDATSQALQHLLESTTSIQKFELIASQFSGDKFRPIARAITRSESVSELKFVRCRFLDRISFAPLQSILLSKRNLTSLCLHGCFFGGGQVHEDIISFLSRPDSLLRCFEFQSRHYLVGGDFPRIQFKNLLQAIQMSKLERFSIGTIQSQQQLQTLTQSIPSMKLKELEVGFRDDEFDRETIKQALLQAVKNNFSLHTVKGEILFHDESDLFDSDEDTQRLAFYANRNESLDQWVNHPETVEPKVWPDVLSLAERAGPDALFRGLHSVLGRDYVALKGGRKRKRTQYYTPS